MGTRADADSCVFCDITSYQDKQGQDVNKPCPSGFKTTVIGASSISECTGIYIYVLINQIKRDFRPNYHHFSINHMLWVSIRIASLRRF